MSQRRNHNHAFKLLAKVKHLAEKRIKAIKQHYDNDSLVELLGGESEKAVEGLTLALDAKGGNFARGIALDVVSSWKAHLFDEYAVFDYLYHAGVSDQNDLKLAPKIAKVFGERSKEVVANNPYALVRFFPWLRVDAWGKKLVGAEDERRLVGAIDYVIRKELSNGHTRCHIQDFVAKIGSYVPNTDKALQKAVETKRIELNGSYVNFFGARLMEKMIAERISVMAGRPPLIPKSKVDACLEHYSQSADFPLSDQQYKAVAQASIHQFHVISGYAGTGKSTALKALVHVLKASGKRIEMCALSGKAALRMMQTSSIHAKTIFRFLRQVKESREFQLEKLPVPKGHSYIDRNTVIIIDEASMVDLGSMAKIFSSLRDETQLILLGDDFQLPPIGFGLVFHELVKIPTITSKLSEVFRQASGNNIPIVGEQIRNGIKPDLPSFYGIEAGIQFLDVEEINPSQLMMIAETLGGFNTKEENLQIVAATNGTVDEINAFMHEAYAKSKKAKDRVDGVLSNSFAVGDPVVFTKNDYKRNLFNGEIGYVLSVKKFAPGAKQIKCAFNGVYHEFNGASEIGDIRLAYALTCHKLQGSQFRRVIVVIENTQLCDPTWLYTAITRSAEQTLVIGSKEDYECLFLRQPAFKKRLVGLSDVLIENEKAEFRPRQRDEMKLGQAQQAEVVKLL